MTATSLSLPLESLRAHPENPNRMTRAARRTLAHHLERAGRCPPVIVRPHPNEADSFEIIDGHHRVEIARELGWSEIDAVIWQASDAETRLLLATLNRVHGVDDPLARAALLSELAGAFDPAKLASLLPESSAELRAFEKLLQPPAITSPPEGAASPTASLDALVFFFPRAEKLRIERALRAIDPDDHRRALLTLIDRHA